MNEFYSIFNNKEISVNLLWKFLLRILEAEKDERTRPELKKFLKKTPTAIYQIINVLERIKIVEVLRDPDLKSRTKEYVEISWNGILSQLLEYSELEEIEKDNLFDYLLPILIKISELYQPKADFTNLFSLSTHSGKLLKIIVEANPPVIVLFFLGLFLINNKSDSSFGKLALKTLNEDNLPIVMNFLGHLMQKLPQEILENIFSDIKIRNIRLNDVIPHDENSKLNTDKIEPESKPFNFSLLMNLGILFTNGFIYDKKDKKLFTSYSWNESPDIALDKPVELKIPLVDGTFLTETIENINIGNILNNIQIEL